MTNMASASASKVCLASVLCVYLVCAYVYAVPTIEATGSRRSVETMPDLLASSGVIHPHPQLHTLSN